jgi:hypothetical protein
MSRKHEECWHLVRGQKEATGFLKQLSAKKSWTINQLEQKPAMQMMGFVNRSLSL